MTDTTPQDRTQTDRWTVFRFIRDIREPVAKLRYLTTPNFSADVGYQSTEAYLEAVRDNARYVLGNITDVMRHPDTMVYFKDWEEALLFITDSLLDFMYPAVSRVMNSTDLELIKVDADIIINEAERIMKQIWSVPTE